MISPSILILPSPASSSRIGSKRAYLIPACLLSLLRSIWPPCSVSIQRTRSRGYCQGLAFLHPRLLLERKSSRTNIEIKIGLAVASYAYPISLVKGEGIFSTKVYVLVEPPDIIRCKKITCVSLIEYIKRL